MSSQIIEMNELKQDNPHVVFVMFKKQTSQLWNINVNNVMKEMSVWIVLRNYGKQIQKKVSELDFPEPPDTWYKSYDVGGIYSSSNN